ncbi:hypothetical protein J132_07956 [Termitomyces sp. J132]|nr:hypothetical protein J132_07956 [Termitomyces sp. J132]
MMNNNVLFPNYTTPEPYDFGAANDQEWFVDDLMGHRWNWEPLANCKDLVVLDKYLELQSMRHLQQLAQCINNMLYASGGD